jgi:hypothetical protein
LANAPGPAPPGTGRLHGPFPPAPATARSDRGKDFGTCAVAGAALGQGPKRAIASRVCDDAVDRSVHPGVDPNVGGPRRVNSKGVHVAASRQPSFLKRQKEQARLARATEKREARRERKHAKANRDASVENAEMAHQEDDATTGGVESEESHPQSE